MWRLREVVAASLTIQTETLDIHQFSHSGVAYRCDSGYSSGSGDIQILRWYCLVFDRVLGVPPFGHPEEYNRELPPLPYGDKTESFDYKKNRICLKIVTTWILEGDISYFLSPRYYGEDNRMLRSCGCYSAAVIDNWLDKNNHYAHYDHS